MQPWHWVSTDKLCYWFCWHRQVLHRPGQRIQRPARRYPQNRIQHYRESLRSPADHSNLQNPFHDRILNGSAVPASAYILWPYLPRLQSDGTFQVVGFAHGTTGIFGECAPSHTRPLQYNYGVTYTLALQGYVVVAPDFAGMGVNRTASGSPILHPYGVNPSAANDLFYAVQAAQSAFATLSKEFVIVGHSQGGSAAWAAAQRQALKPVAGKSLQDLCRFDLGALRYVLAHESKTISPDSYRTKF